MKKMKIAAILIGAMFVGLATTSVSGEQILGTEIDITINSFIGLVSPSVTTPEEEVINLGVEVNESHENATEWTYELNDTIVINIGYNDLSGREAFVLPRLMFYRIVAMRDFADRDNGKGGLLDKLFPIKAGFGQVGVVNTTGGSERAKNITIKVDYKITNETYAQAAGEEQFTLRIFTMGFLPGNILGNGGFLDGQIPIIDYKEVNLTVNYEEKDYIGP
jgi:hypothetical protein